jgi:hypothetical protein
MVQDFPSPPLNEEFPRVISSPNRNPQREVMYVSEEQKYKRLIFTAGSILVILFNVGICLAVLIEIFKNKYDPISYFTAASTFVGSLGGLALIYNYILGDKRK